ncbi:MAG: histidine kinase dimerization/phospho-acceptor domain-containing protein [Eggerthellaceae bacterium]
MERERSAEDAHRIRLQAEQESLRANLLRSISHDLRTPLTSISGDASILLSSADALRTTRSAPSTPTSTRMRCGS